MIETIENAIKRLIKSNTVNALIIVFAENFFSKGINFVLALIVARTLGPHEYGVYALITVSVIFLSMLLDLSMVNPVIRFSSKNPEKKEGLFGVYFLIKTVLLLVVGLIVWFYPQSLGILLRKPQIEKYIFIILAGCAIESYQLVITTYLQSLERYILRAMINVGVLLFRLVLILLLLKTQLYNVRIIALCFALGGMPFLMYFTPTIFTFLKKRNLNKIKYPFLKEISHYAKWIFLGSVATNVMTRLDFYIVASMLTFREAGLYQAAFQLVAPFVILRIVFSTVFLPKVTKYNRAFQFKNYFKKVFTMGACITLIILLIIPFSERIIVMIFGNSFIEASIILRILLISFLFSICNVMIGQIFYSLGHSKYMSIGAYWQLAIFVLVSLFLIPKLGMKGAAISKLIAAVSYLVIVVYFYKTIICKEIRALT